MHGADYGFAVTPDSTTVAPGSSFAFTITLTSQAGFTDTIGLNAVSGVGANPPSFDALRRGRQSNRQHHRTTYRSIAQRAKPLPPR